MSTLLQAQRRQLKSSSELNQLRNNGRIPAILYGMDKENEIIHLDQAEVSATFRSEGSNAILEVAVENNPSEKVIVADLQTHPIKNQILHIDLKRVDMSEEMTALTPIIITGEADSEGLKRGGVLQNQLRELEIRCLPANLPDSFSIDISHLEIGDSVTVGDVEVPEGVEVQNEKDEVIASITAPRLDSVETEGEEEEGAEGSEETSASENE